MGDALPVLTRIVISAGDGLIRYGWLLLLLLGMTVYVVRHWLRSEEGRAKFDESMVRLPFFGAIIFGVFLKIIIKTWFSEPLTIRVVIA